VLGSMRRDAAHRTSIGLSRAFPLQPWDLRSRQTVDGGRGISNPQSLGKGPTFGDDLLKPHAAGAAAGFSAGIRALDRLTTPSTQRPNPQGPQFFQPRRTDPARRPPVTRLQYRWSPPRRPTAPPLPILSACARARLRDRSACIAEGDVLGTGRDFIAALRRAGNRVEPAAIGRSGRLRGFQGARCAVVDAVPTDLDGSSVVGISPPPKRPSSTTPMSRIMIRA
jgi:hypothetical protein